MKVFKIIGFVFAMASIVGCGDVDKTDVNKTAAVKDGWRRLDPKHYAAMDDVSLLKRWVEIDCTGTLKKDVESKGGIEAMLAKVGGKIEEKGRKCFANLVFLHDALVGMGASHTVVTAVVDKASHAYYLKWKMSVDDVAATLPGVAELYGILAGINTPPADMAEYLVADYINTDVEKRADRIKRYREKAEKYHVVKDALVSSGISRKDAEAGLRPFVFRHGSGLDKDEFRKNEMKFSEIDVDCLKAIIPECRKIRNLYLEVRMPGRRIAEMLVRNMAIPPGEHGGCIGDHEKFVATIKEFAKEKGVSYEMVNESIFHVMEKAKKAGRKVKTER